MALSANQYRRHCLNKESTFLRIGTLGLLHLIGSKYLSRRRPRCYTRFAWVIELVIVIHLFKSMLAASTDIPMPESLSSSEASRIAQKSVSNDLTALSQAEEYIRVIPPLEVPSNSSAHFRLGDLSHESLARKEYKQKHYEAAIKEFVTATLEDSTNANLYALCGNCYFCIGQWSNAVHYYSISITLKPTSDFAFLNRGHAYLNQGELAYALADLHKAAQLCPTNARAYDLLASACLTTRDLSAALSNINVAIALTPKDPGCYLLRGQIRLHQQDLTNSIRDFAQAEQLLPDDPTVHRYLAHAEACLGDWQQTIKESDIAVELAPSGKFPTLLLDRAFAQSKVGNNSAAFEDVEAALAIDPRSGRAYNLRGTLNYREGRLDEAYADYLRAVRCNPNNCIYLVNVALVSLQNGQYQEALEMCDKAIGMGSQIPSGFTIAAKASAKLGHYTQATQYYEDALQRHAVDSDTYDGFAWLLATCADGQIRDGPRSVRLAIVACDKTKWSKGSCVKTLAAAYAESGDFERAVEYQKKAIALIDNDAISLKEQQDRLRDYQNHTAYVEKMELK